jgi:serine/threonine protein kinase/tetratricopeptide (TPR) repeat protein
MGEVYKARDTRLGREVAVKVLPAEFASDPERLRRFEQEARAAAALNHPNILVLYDIGSHEGAPYIVTELLEGETLRERLCGGALTPAKAVELGVQIAQGLSAAHEKGIVHRDLKPENLWVTKDGHVKILDFGLARLKSQGLLEKEPQTEAPTADIPTREGKVLGTPGYMSPEQIRGKPVDARTDIFAFGVVLYEMLAGKRAFAGDTAADTQSAILTKDPQPLPPTSPIAMDRIVGHCLEKRPDDRFSSAHDLALALQSVSLTGEVGSAPALGASVPPPSAPAVVEPAPGGWLRRHWPKLLAGVAAVAFIALVVGWAVWFRGGKPGAKGPALNPKRVAVATFENQTGDRSLDSLGRMASDSLSQGLSKVTGIEVVPSSAGAGRMVSGTYYLQGQTLRFQMKVADAATGQVVYAPEPFTGPREEPAEIIDALCQRTMGAVAWDAFGQNLALVPPPTYEAFQEFLAGMQLFANDPPQSIRRLERASEIDPQFAAPLFYVEGGCHNLAEYEKEAEVINRLSERREKLTPYQQHLLEHDRALLAGRYTAAVLEARQFLKLAPEDPNSLYIAAFTAEWANMPNLAVEVSPDPTAEARGERMSRTVLTAMSFCVLADACHLLSDYKRELEVANRGLAAFPDVLEIRLDKVRALAGLGRDGEVITTVDETLGSTFADLLTPGDLMLFASLELRTHGNREAAVRMASRAVEWLRGRPASEQAADRSRPAMAEALYAAERWDDARALYQQLAEEHPVVKGTSGTRGDPKNPQTPEGFRIYRAIEYLGALGALAARRGDRAEAQRISDELARIDYKYLFGNHTYRRACIAAQLGDKGRAASLLQEAAAQGFFWRFVGGMQCWGIAFHVSQDLEPLHGYPPYEEVLKPKG